MVKVLRRASRVALAALLLGGLTAGPAMAAEDSSPDAAYYESSVTAIQPAVPGLELRVRSEDGHLTLVNHTGKTVTVVGYGGEDYLRIAPNGAEENSNSLTSAINASPSLDKLSSAGAATSAAQPPKWVKRGEQPTTTWRDYRVLWTNKQRPPIVETAPHSEHKVFSWAVQLKVGSQPVLVLGDVRWTGAPWETTTQLVLIAVVLAAILLAVWVFLRRRGIRSAGRRGARQTPVKQVRTPLPSMRGY
jgi:hypothetical protein